MFRACLVDGIIHTGRAQLEQHNHLALKAIFRVRKGWMQAAKSREFVFCLGETCLPLPLRFNEPSPASSSNVSWLRGPEEPEDPAAVNWL